MCGAGDESESSAVGRISIGQVDIRVAPARSVENIKHVGSKLNGDALADPGILDDPEVLTLRAWATNVRKESRRGAEVKWETIIERQGWFDERSRVQVGR